MQRDKEEGYRRDTEEGHRGRQRDTQGYRGKQWDTGGCTGMQRDTDEGYRGIQRRDTQGKPSKPSQANPSKPKPRPLIVRVTLEIIFTIFLKNWVWTSELRPGT